MQELISRHRLALYEYQLIQAIINFVAHHQNIFQVIVNLPEDYLAKVCHKLNS
jgi:hypothetical protein